MGPSAGPRISVIVPVYNGSASLGRCLEAITSSDYPDFECIVVDDASTDDTPAVAAGFPVRTLTLDEGPSGPGHGRNRGAELATGEILFFVDADVVIHRDTVRLVAESFLEHPDFDAVFGSYDDSPGAGDFTSQYKNLFHHFVHQQGREEAGTFWAGCGAIRKPVFLEMGGFDARRYPRPCIEDIELGYRLRAAGHKILLNHRIQGKHLKRWTLLGIIRSDVVDRGIPWTRLILEHRDLPDDLNVQRSQRVSAALLAVMALVLALGAFFHGVTLLLPLLLVLFLLVVGRMRGGSGGAGSHAAFVITVLALTAAMGLLLWSLPAWLTGVLLGLLAVLILLNRRFYAFFARKRGAVFALAVVPFHLLYYLYSMLALVLGTGRYYWTDRAKRPC